MEIPAEGTPAGNILAIMMGMAPLIAILLGSTIKPRLVAFFVANLVSWSIVGGGVFYALEAAPGNGTEFACKIFGGVAAGLSFVMASAIAGGRALYAKSATAR